MAIHVFEHPEAVGPPTFAPTLLNQHWTSTDGKSYISVGVASADDWIEITFTAAQFAAIQFQIDAINSNIAVMEANIATNTADIANLQAAIDALTATIPNATFTGDIDGVNDVFTITEAGFDPATVMIWSDGLFLQVEVSYTLTGVDSEIITITDPDRIPIETFVILLNI